MKPACQPFASGSNRYTGNPYLENYGPINAISENAETWFQVPAQKKLQLDMSESFLGFGWRSIERFNKISYRRLAFGHNEGLVLLRLEKGARYKLRLSYWKDMPQNIASKLSVSFNGVKLSPRLSDDGDLGFMDFVLDEQLTGVCNGWIEVMVSTAGNASRPQSGRRNKWSGLYFLLQNISILREIEQR